jgi:RNA polymerase sigma-54 factor
VQQIANFISTLEPKPGRMFNTEQQQYVAADVVVQNVSDKYVVLLNNEQIPHLRISNSYKELMASADKSTEAKDYIRDKVRAGKFLIKSIHQRQQTIQNIAKVIVDRQREFLDKGIAFLKPLTMAQVAEVVGVHETTVSRAVANKYMQTPQGLFEMKYFFTPGFETASGTAMSNTSVKEQISKLIEREDTLKPLSDQEIVAILKEQGIPIARRTVAKYRNELNILPSNLRKKY